MADKTFVVSHAKARMPLIVQGKNLKDALERDGLDPTIWKEIEPPYESEVDDPGNSKGNARPEDN